jgi:hypothetical protein
MMYALPKPQIDGSWYTPATVQAAYAAGLADGAPKWLPIESAPKDGRALLLWGEWAGEIAGLSGVNVIDIGFWNGGKSDFPGDSWWASSGGDAYACWIKAKKWMPLSEAPETKP